MRRQTVHLRRIAIATHERNACDGASVTREKSPEQVVIERFAFCLAQVGAVASRAAIGTRRKIQGERHLSRNFLKNHIVTCQK